MFCRWILLCFVVVASPSSVVADFPGECPQMAPVANFDLDRFAEGKWFLAEQTDNDRDRCVAMEINKNPANTIHKTGRENDGDVIDKLKSFSMSTRGIFSFSDPRDGDSEDEIVLATDYDTFSVVYACEYDRGDNDHEEEVAIYVRQSEVEDPSAAVNRAKEAIRAAAIQSTVFYPTDQTNCSL